MELPHLYRRALRAATLPHPGPGALGRLLVDEGTSVRAAARVLCCHHVTLYRVLGAAADVIGSN